MTWIKKEDVHKCQMPEQDSDHGTGDVWECPYCPRAYELIVIDYGHDVMPGEKSTGWSWKEVN